MRLMVVALAFLAASGLAYPYFDKIVEVIVTPLGKESQLVYLTPGGAFGFMIQVCIAVGVLAALPVAIYQMYRFLAPAVRRVNPLHALMFAFASMILGLIGVAFGYFVGLPAALHFLTSFDFYHVNPMLTIDSYFSFVMTYITSSALLFQLPLIMLAINSVTPMSPGGLMKYQDKMILASFIFAAIISPTPDAVNQGLLASPIVVMYQVGIVLVWAVNRKRRISTHKALAPVVAEDSVDTLKPHVPSSKARQTPQRQVMADVGRVLSVPARQPVSRAAPALRSRSMDFVRTPQPMKQPRELSRTIAGQARQSTVNKPPSPVRSIDGFYVRVRS